MKGPRNLTDLLAWYELLHPEDQEVVRQFRALARAAPLDCLSRHCLPGHVTASAWILDADHRRCLLVHHRKLDRWLQVGGHVEGDPELHQAALREAREETGMQVFDLPRREGRILPLDLDVHSIPAGDDEPRHLHYDVRFLLVAGPGQEPRASEESHDVRWIPRERLSDYTAEESVLRLDRRAAAALG